MINLLPSKEKEGLLLEKREKLIMIGEAVFAIFLICLILVLLSIKFYILAETDYQKNILSQAQQENQSPDLVNLNNTIKKYNTELAQLGSFYKTEVYFSQALNIITGVSAPGGLYFTSFSLNRDKNGMIQAEISGVSDTRDELLGFRQNIEQDKRIKNSSFSPESWTSAKNVNFSLTLEIDQNEK